MLTVVDRTEETIAALKDLTTRYLDFLEHETAARNRIVARVATVRGYTAQLDEGDRDKHVKEANEIVTDLMADKIPTDFPVEIISDLNVFKLSLRPILKQRDVLAGLIAKEAKKLPVHRAWAKDVKGFGDLSLGLIVGVAGDVGKYSSTDGFRVRLGLAPFTRVDGATRACSTWRYYGGLSKDEWVSDEKSGYRGPQYNPQRRAISYAWIEPSLLKAQIQSAKKNADGVAKPKGKYGAIYLTYKDEQSRKNDQGAFAELAAALVAGARAKNRKPNAHNLHGRLSPKHIDNRARRRMSQALMDDLWNAWRRAILVSPNAASNPLPAAMHLEAAE